MPLPRFMPFRRPLSLSAHNSSFGRGCASATLLSSALLRLNISTSPPTPCSRTNQHNWLRVLKTSTAPSRINISVGVAGNISPLLVTNRNRSAGGRIMTTTTTQKRSHGGHSHHHHHDNTYLISANKKDAGVRITRIGLYSNLGMAIAKGVGGYVFHSQSMVADAWHSLTDLASDILTLATVSWSLKPPTAMFPTGFGKVESLGSLGVSGMLLGGGLFMCLNSCEILYAHFLLDAHAAAEALAHSHGHGHSHGPISPSLNAAWLALGTVVVKEWLYQATMKVAKERKSSVLASNAVHHRVDSLTGIVTLFAILGANFLHNAEWLDPVGGLLISLLVIKAGWGNTTSALYELADKSIDDEVRASVRTAATSSLGELRHGDDVILREVQGVKSGQNYLVDLELAVPKTWTVEEVREVEEAIRTMVGSKVRGVRRLKMRFVPKEIEASLIDEFIGGDITKGPNPASEESAHDHDHDHKHGDGLGKKSQ